MSGRSFARIATEIPVSELLRAIYAHPELWQATQRETFQGSPHATAQSIILRWARLEPGEDPVAASFEKTQDIEDQPNIQWLLPSVAEAVMSILERLGAIGDLGRVMLTRLPKGASIASHVDEGTYADYFDRFHLCLQGDLGNIFECGTETYYPQPGELFWFNHKRIHSVRNTGTKDRIHLIVDVMAPHFTRLRGLYYQRELVSNLWNEAQPLLEAHWREVAHYQDIELKPDIAAYHQLQAMNELRCYTARDGGKLVGYAVFFVRPNPHYSSSLQAHQDVLFLLSDYRRGTTGVRLIQYAEEKLQAEGVQVIYHHAKRTNKVGELLERLGYELVDEIYAKRLD